MTESSTRPYLIRAIHEWCADNGMRPFLTVVVDERTMVPREFVRDGQIVLNIADHAVNRLRIGNDLIEFEARFSGSVRQLSIPVENVSAIYAAENGQGMAFEVGAPAAEAAPAPLGEMLGVQAPEPAPAVVQPITLAPVPAAALPSGTEPPRDPSGPAPGVPRRPTLTRVK